VTDRSDVRVFTTLEQLSDAAGEPLGTSDWLLVDQERVSAFAETTEDRQWIHVDSARAAAGPLGGTIAHGFLTLSLLPVFGEQIFAIETPGPKLNYGLDRVRFPRPVRVGSRIRGHATLGDVVDVAGGKRVTISYRVEIEGEEKPACVADFIILATT
jgi:acyl dehydratase